jgi:hypothetical protein
VALLFTLKSILRKKRRITEVEIFISPCTKNRIPNPKNPSKRNQNPSGYYYNNSDK